LETVRLRYSNIFGLRQSPSSPHARIVPDALTAMLAEQEPPLEGTGLEPQDLVYVDDAVQATLLAADVPGISGRVYNVAQGRTTKALEVVATLNELLETHLTGVRTGRPLEHELQNAIDISRARTELGFSPTVTLRDGLTRCVRAVSPALGPGPKRGIERFTEA
jgi:UDP-glucose 4-epimerase